MNRLKKNIDKLSENNLFSFYLPIFRVFISFHILKKLYLNMGSISIVFDEDYGIINRTVDKLPFFKLNFIFEIPLIIQFTIVFSILYMFGVFKNYIAVLLCVCNFILNDIFSLFGNGGDNLLYFLLMYMTFTNSFKFFSVGNYKESKISNLISNLGFLAILLHLTLIYFVSGIHKLHSDLWFNGVAIYYILNIERFCSPLNHLISKNAFIIAFLTYSTILFEILFPILIWFKNFRVFFLFAGLLMHLGIYFFMMIYDFEILFIMIYGFYISNERWQKILTHQRFKWIKIA